MAIQTEIEDLDKALVTLTGISEGGSDVTIIRSAQALRIFAGLIKSRSSGKEEALLKAWRAVDEYIGTGQ